MKQRNAIIFDRALKDGKSYSQLSSSRDIYGFLSRFINSMDADSVDADFITELLDYRDFNYLWYLHRAIQGKQDISTPFELVNPDQRFSFIFTLMRIPAEDDYLKHPHANHLRIALNQEINISSMEAMLSDYL